MNYRQCLQMFVGLLAASSAAFAFDDEHEVDIDKLKGEIWFSQDRWHVGMNYVVEIDSPRAGAVYILEIQFKQNDRPVIDKDGKRISIVIELDRPSKRKDNEFEFANVATVDLLREYITVPDKVEIVAAVYEQKTAVTLDTKDSKVKYRKRPPRPDGDDD